jgi:hypothetical protein
MIKTWPHVHTDGWHLEAGWTWDSFGLVANTVWNQAIVLHRLGLRDAVELRLYRPVEGYSMTSKIFTVQCHNCGSICYSDADGAGLLFALMAHRRSVCERRENDPTARPAHEDRSPWTPLHH